MGQVALDIFLCLKAVAFESRLKDGNKNINNFDIFSGAVT